MIYNLKRTAGVYITDWLWFLEWHTGGYAHYHLFIEVRDAGSSGQIGGGLLRHYWPYGRVVEGYVTDLDHWRSLTGYFNKKGYFERKWEAGDNGEENRDGSLHQDHQIVLPEWAAKYRKSIRRFGCQRVVPG